jgi:hypothetical protein
VVVVARDGATTEVAKTPASAAYGVSSDLVVFQDAKATDGSFAPAPEGPVRVWSGGKVRTLVANAKASRTELLDARLVDGVPTALVSEWLDGGGPDDTFEELVRIDLRNASRITLVRRDGWESSHDAARLLPGGDVAGLFHSAADVFLARWSPETKEPLWSVQIGTDVSIDLSRLDGVIATVESRFDPARRISTVVDVTKRDPATGSVKTAETVGLKETDGKIDTNLWCRDWLGPTRLACGRSSGAPVAISLEDGAITALPGEPGALPMVIPPS